jgi:hypothetical protein
MGICLRCSSRSFHEIESPIANQGQVGEAIDWFISEDFSVLLTISPIPFEPHVLLGLTYVYIKFR